MQHNLSLADGLDRVERWMLAHAGMWPAVAFRLLAVDDDHQSLLPSLRVLAVHFQASPSPQTVTSKIRLHAPTVIEGALSASGFLALLKRWGAGNHGQVDQWAVAPPEGLGNFWWQYDVPVAENQFPLIEELPDHPTTY